MNNDTLPCYFCKDKLVESTIEYVNGFAIKGCFKKNHCFSVLKSNKINFLTINDIHSIDNEFNIKYCLYINAIKNNENVIVKFISAEFNAAEMIFSFKYSNVPENATFKDYFDFFEKIKTKIKKYIVLK